ncbi:DUF5363 family protein [Vibrio sp. TBV020]
MLNWFKRALAKYDAWCQSMGLTPENKRSCVPYRAEPNRQIKSNDKAQN